MYMRKLFAIICAAALLLSMAACSQSNGETSSSEREETESVIYPVEDMSLSDVLDDILQDVPDLPSYEPTELTAENFEFYTFVPYAEDYEGLAADSLIGSIAHSVVLVRVQDDTDASQVAKDIKDNANPRKWICVETETTHVRQYGDTILLVMSSAEIANAVLVNFDALNGVDTPESDLAEVKSPDIDPDGNDGEPEDPVEEPQDPAEKPQEPAEKPQEPAEKPQEPAEKPQEPAEEPQEPAEKPQEPAEKPQEPAEGSTDLNATLNSILSGITDLPACQTAELTADNFEFYTFISYVEGYRGIGSEPMLGASAHSVVLVEVPEGTDASTVAADMESNANPNKWICATAESVQTAVKGQLILLVMSTQAHADAIVANFNAL